MTRLRPLGLLACLIRREHGPLVHRNSMLGALTNTDWRSYCQRCGTRTR